MKMVAFTGGLLVPCILSSSQEMTLHVVRQIENFRCTFIIKYMQPGSLSGVQGEDVVAGIRTPEDIDTMRQALPDAYKELLENCDILESHYKEMMVFLTL